jgi:succinate dehydrogenase flavin-adding protein (antitoxin of CptAB toxin-antitoxin module)
MFKKIEEKEKDDTETGEDEKLLNKEDRDSFHLHMKTHPEEAESQCDICAQLFNTKVSLIKHCRTEHGEAIRMFMFK